MVIGLQTHPHVQLLAQKGVRKVGLEALMLILDHLLLNISFQI